MKIEDGLFITESEEEMNMIMEEINSSLEALSKACDEGVCSRGLECEEVNQRDTPDT